jgi:hypothetical protein
MSWSLCGAVSVLLGVAIGWLAPAAQAVDIWSGLTKTFTKPDGADGLDPAFQDVLTPGVIFAREGTGGIFNAAVEPNFLRTVSPEFTEWATDLMPGNAGEAIVATNWADLTFDVFTDAYGGAVGFNGPGRNAVVHLVFEDIYLDLRITNWTDGHQIPSGGFSYMRAEPPAPEPTGDYNGDHIVNAADYTVWRNTLGTTATPQGTGADGEPDGMIDVADYVFWKQHFGELVPGNAGAGAQALGVPEPTIGLLLLIGLLISTVSRRFSPCGPGQYV